MKHFKSIVLTIDREFRAEQDGFLAHRCELSVVMDGNPIGEACRNYKIHVDLMGNDFLNKSLFRHVVESMVDKIEVLAHSEKVDTGES